MNTKLTNLPVIRWFLPRSHRGSNGSRARGISLYLLFNFLILLAGLPFTYIFFYQLERPVLGVVLVAGLCMLVLGMLIVRLTDRLKFAAHWSSFAIYMTITLLSLFTGGIEAPAMWWLMLCPVYALFFAGKRSGFFWASLIVFTVIGLYAGQGYVSTASSSFQTVDQQWLLLSSFLGLNVCIIGYVTAYRYFITDYQLKQLEEGRRSEREAREAAQKANQAKTQFLANTSHEIRTPINTITGVIEILRSSDLNEQHREHLDVAEEAAHQLLQAINDILDISRLEAGSRVIQHESLRVRSVVERLMQSLAPEATKKGLELNLHVSPSVPINLKGDEGILQQILHNLVYNAIRYTPEGHVDLNVERDQQVSGSSKLRFQVQDTGVGIPVNEQEQIFEAFQRSSHPLMDELRGTGIGLSLSKSLVELLGGEITVESELGEGSIFSFTAVFQLEGVQPEYPTYQTDDLQDVRVLVYNRTPSGADENLKLLENGGLQATFVQSLEEVTAELKGSAEQEESFDLLMVKWIGDEVEALDDLLERIDGELEEQMPPVLVLVQPPNDSFDPKFKHADGWVESPLSSSTLLKQMKEFLTVQGGSPSSEISSVPKEREKRSARRVLFAEDNGPVRSVVTMQLEHQGYKVHPVSNGQEAVEQIQDQDYDVVLMDVQMPKLNGLEAMEKIRDMETNKRDVPIIALTAQALETDREHCLEAGFTEYMTKPADGETLQDMIEQVVSDENEEDMGRPVR